MRAFLSVILLSCTLLSGVTARNFYYTPTNGSDWTKWRGTLSTLQPGDVLTFATGTYNIPSTSKLGITINGNANAPIIVQGESTKGAKWFRPDDVSPSDKENMIDIQGSWFIMQNLEMEGGSRGVRLGENGDVSHAVFRNLVIHRTETTAFSANQGTRTYTNLTVVNNEIYDTGSTESECFYFGCQSNGCHTQDSLIDRNYCHDTLQATSGSLGSGIQVKTGSYNNRITNNVVKDTRGPCILIYDSYDMGVNHVEGNYCENNGDNGIQATSGSVIINNIIINKALSGIRIANNQPKSGSVIRDNFIAHNTVLCSGASQSCIRVDETGAQSTNTIVNNAIFSTANSALSQTASTKGGKCGNNGLFESSASAVKGATDFTIRSAAQELKDPVTTKNMYPLPTSKLIGAGDASVLSKVPLDFDGNTRTSNSTVGAFAYTEGGSNGSNPTGVKPTFTADPSSNSNNPTVAGGSNSGTITVPSGSSKVICSILFVCFLIFAMLN